MKRFSIFSIILITLGLGMNCAEQPASTASLYSLQQNDGHIARMELIEVKHKLEALQNKVENMERYIKKPIGLLGGFSEARYELNTEPSLDERVKNLEDRLSTVSSTVHSLVNARIYDQTPPEAPKQ